MYPEGEGGGGGERREEGGGGGGGRRRGGEIRQANINVCVSFTNVHKVSEDISKSKVYICMHAWLHLSKICLLQTDTVTTCIL